MRNVLLRNFKYLSKSYGNGLLGRGQVEEACKLPSYGSALYLIDLLYGLHGTFQTHDDVCMYIHRRAYTHTHIQMVNGSSTD